MSSGDSGFYGLSDLDTPFLVETRSGRWPQRVWCFYRRSHVKPGTCPRCGAVSEMKTLLEMQAEANRDFNIVSGLDSIGK